MVRESSGTIERSVASYIRPTPWHCGQAPSGLFVEKASPCSSACPGGYFPAREYSIRNRFDNVETLPTDDRVVGEPRCCCNATAGGNPSMASTSGTPI